MRGAVLHAPGDVRVEERADPTIEQPTDAVIRLAATCVCGSDLWPYRGIEAGRRARADGPRVRRRRRGGRQRRPHRPARPVRRRLVLRLRQHLRDLPGRLPVPLRARRAGRRHRHPGRVRRGSRWPTAPSSPPPSCRPTTWSRACWPPPTCSAPAGSAPSPPRCGPGKTVAVVGDGAVGLLGVLAARQLGAERIIAMSRHESRQKLALEFGATDIVTERGDEGVAADQGPHRRPRRALGDRGRRHPGVDDAGHPRHPSRRARRLRRRRPRRRAARRRAVLLRRPPARRPGPGPPVPARADRADLAAARSTPARSST